MECFTSDRKQIKPARAQKRNQTIIILESIKIHRSVCFNRFSTMEVFFVDYNAHGNRLFVHECRRLRCTSL